MTTYVVAVIPEDPKTRSSLRLFRPPLQMWVGRWAQIGIASSIVGEFVSGKGTLGQLGLTDGTPSTPVLAALCLLMGGATLVGSAITLKKLITKTMTKT